MKLGRTPGGIAGPPPGLGEHTDEVLRLAPAIYPREEIAALRETEVVFRPPAESRADAFENTRRNGR